MRREWEEFRLAGAFLTVLPVARGLEMPPERLGRSMAFFPAVGLVIGLALLVLDWALGVFLPRAVLDCLLILVLVVATGALHLDGIADLVDGLAGGKDREGVLRIMKDSRVGAVGAVGLVMVLLLKYLSLVNVPLEHKSAALLFMPATGRWIQVVLAAYCPYIRPGGGTGSAFVDNVGGRETLLASVTLLAAAVICFGVTGFFILVVLGLAALALIRYFEKRLGGVTGDVLGASTEIVEVFTLLLILAVI